MTPLKPSEQDPAAFILRTVDGAGRPLVVEKVFGNWQGNVVHAWSGDRVRDPFFLRWPEAGAAWEEFKDPIRRLIEQGDLVMCTTTDPPDHPEYHLTQGHGDHRVFPYGSPPMVLRYLATPAGSIAWKAILEERRREDEEYAAARERYLAQLPELIRTQLAVAPRTDGWLARKLSVSHDDVSDAILALFNDGLIEGAGYTIWRRYRWKAKAPDA